MAKEAKPEAEAVVAAAPKKSKKLLIMVAIALVLVFLVVGGGALFLMKKHSASTDEEVDASSEAVKNEKKSGAKEVAPVYVALDAFTVNLVGDQFLQLVISVEVSDLLVGDRLKNFTPKIRNNVMLLLSGKKASDLITKEGKEALANEIRDLISDILEPGAKGGDGPVKEVLFTSFIIQ
jgi:flagellar protein FliL